MCIYTFICSNGINNLPRDNWNIHNNNKTKCKQSNLHMQIVCWEPTVNTEHLEMSQALIWGSRLLPVILNKFVKTPVILEFMHGWTCCHLSCYTSKLLRENSTWGVWQKKMNLNVFKITRGCLFFLDKWRGNISF